MLTRLLLVLTLGLSSLVAANDGTSDSPGVQQLTFNTEEYPPFNYLADNGQIDGTATRLLRLALQELDGVAVEFRLLPWARAYTEARLRDNHCVYSTNRTTEREPWFQWVGPLESSDWSAYALQERGLQLDSLASLQGYRVGSSHEDAVGLYAVEQGVAVVNASRDGENIQRLKAGIVDVWITSSPQALQRAAAQQVELVRLFTFNQTQLYLACHLSVNRELLASLQAAIDRVRDSDDYHQARNALLEAAR